MPAETNRGQQFREVPELQGQLGAPPDPLLLVRLTTPRGADPIRDHRWKDHQDALISNVAKGKPPIIRPPRQRATDVDSRVIPVPPPPGLPLRRRSRPGAGLTSPNWSGAWVVPVNGDQLTGVAAQWTIPDVKAGVPSPDNALPYRCSIWTGIDGQHRWAGSMPQIGTEHTVANDGITHKAWVQWWKRGGGTVPVYLDGITLSTGHDIACGLALSDDFRTTTFHIKNLTTGEMTLLEAECDIPAYGSSAEWVVERPGNTPEAWNKQDILPGYLHPLPNFDRVQLDNFVASGALGTSYGSDRAQLISLMELRRDPPRAVTMAGASRDPPSSQERWV